MCGGEQIQVAVCARPRPPGRSRRQRAGCAPASFVVALAAIGSSGCLPDDTRPVPGRLEVTTVGSTATVQGFETEDGWTVTIDRLLLGIGALELEGDGCNHYGQTRYTRLFDFTVGDQPHRVGIAYALGDCDLGFDLRTPESNSLRGPGVSEGDIAAMRAATVDAWVFEAEPTSVLVIGGASDGARQVRFEWRFRKQYEIKACSEGPTGEPGTAVAIEGEAELGRLIAVDARELFRGDDEAEEMPLRFGEMADADANGDGDVSLAELEDVAAPLDPGPEPGGPEPEAPSLADRLYDARVPRMARPPGSGPCEVEID
jgi:hypothetical protein